MAGTWPKPTAYTTEQAKEWREEYDADDTLTVADMAGRHEEVTLRQMRTALLSAGGELRRTRATRRRDAETESTGD